MRQHPSSALILATTLLVPASLMFSAQALAAFSQDLRMEPQPFRQAQVLEGREFDYNAESFLHRSSFAPGTPVTPDVIPKDRLTGTGGSTRSKELFFDVAIQTSYEFSETLDFQYRFRRTEDYDGRYDRNLVGVGFAGEGGAHFRLMADVEGDKSRTDLQPELTWEHPDGHQLKAALVLSDALFNSKQSENEFRRNPRTWFLAGRWQATPNHSFRGYLNVTPETELQINADNTLFRDRNGRVGAGWDWDMDDGRHWQWIAEAEGTDRSERFLGDSEDDEMTRRFWRSRAEYRAPVLGMNYRVGGQAMFLREKGEFIGANRELTDRKEWMGFSGIDLRLNPRWSFTPTVYGSVIEGESVNFDDEPGEEENLNGFYAKLTLPFNWRPEGATGASITLNPTFRLHRAAFGGGNLQMHIPL